MQYITTYSSPLGNVILACDTIGLIGLWFENQKYVKATLSPEHIYIKDAVHFPTPLFDSVRWLDLYFSGALPDFIPSLHLIGTPFQIEVWKNPISIIVPCHRVVGANGKLTGYAGGVERKKNLLILEGMKLI